MNKIELKEEQENIKNLSIPHNLEKGEEVINNYAKILTSAPGVYRMINIDNNILYIGKAKNLKKRVKSYTNINSQSNRIKRMISQTNKMEFIITKSETEALLLEANLIKKYKPPFNILMRDDKSFLKILINKEHKAPRLMKHRGKNIYKGDYYGPFTSASSVNKSINAFQKAFLLRTCTDNVFNNRSRPCLLYQIKRCSAPCTEEIKPTEYNKLVDGLNLFLNGKTEEITNTIYQEMQELSKSLDYEGAAILRDRLEAINF
jgi:excinuclease ABC subunit C